MAQRLADRIETIRDSIRNRLDVQGVSDEEWSSLEDCFLRLVPNKTGRQLRDVLVYIAGQQQEGYASVEFSLRRALNVWDQPGNEKTPGEQ